MPASELLDTPFWAFSLTVYGGEGVEKECLELQERLSLDVNLLLFVAYIGAVESVALDKSDIAAANAAVAGWHGEIVRALRTARRALKPPSTDSTNPLRGPSAALRAQVKAAELQAEKIEQAMLWQWSRAQLANRPRSGRDHALAGNLRAVFEFYGVIAAAAETVPRLRDAAAAYAP